MGALSETAVPRFILRPVLSAYCSHFGVDMSEAERPLDAYVTFNDFFTRALRAGLRPLDADPAAVLSPVDGRVYASGSIDEGTILQAKGVPYSVAELLGSEGAAAPLRHGTFATFYLSPKDYHRIHWPFEATIARVLHLPGDLWPVNDAALASIPRLFARNERAPILGSTSAGASFAMVPVGALNVGSIRLAFHSLVTNRWGKAVPREFPFTPAHAAQRGHEAARFAFGSAVVLLLSPEAGRLDALEPGTLVRQGRRVGTLAT